MSKTPTNAGIKLMEENYRMENRTLIKGDRAQWKTVDDAISFAEKASDGWRVVENPVMANNMAQLVSWLRELQTLRAAMNMEPRLVTG